MYCFMSSWCAECFECSIHVRPAQTTLRQSSTLKPHRWAINYSLQSIAHAAGVLSICMQLQLCFPPHHPLCHCGWRQRGQHTDARHSTCNTSPFNTKSAPQVPCFELGETKSRNSAKQADLSQVWRAAVSLRNSRLLTSCHHGLYSQQDSSDSI